MKFEFNVNVDDNDYLDYNAFWLLRSHYGKKQMLNFRIFIAVIFGLGILYVLHSGGFTLVSFIATLPMLILLVVMELLFSPFYIFFLKGYLKSLKKRGKMGYSPASIIAFHEEFFIETTPNNKTEYKYSAVERISIIEDKVVYIHLNNILSYILPFSCFENKEQYNEFIKFMKTKCTDIDRY